MQVHCRRAYLIFRGTEHVHVDVEKGFVVFGRNSEVESWNRRECFEKVRQIYFYCCGCSLALNNSYPLKVSPTR